MSTYETILSVTNIILALCGGAAIITAIVACQKYITQLEDTARNNDYERTKLACDLARYFAEEIIPSASLFRRVLEKSNEEAYETYRTIFPANRLVNFDALELSELLSASKHDEKIVSNILNGVTPAIIYNEKLKNCRNDSERVLIAEYYLEVLKDNPSEEGIQKKALLLSDYKANMMSLQNKLEWFSMNFRKKMADEDTVYQSLHQWFLFTVKLLYYPIAKENSHNPDKYYSNIIWLYNHWNNKLKEDEQKQQQRVRDAQSPLRNVFPVE